MAKECWMKTHDHSSILRPLIVIWLAMALAVSSAGTGMGYANDDIKASYEVSNRQEIMAGSSLVDDQQAAQPSSAYSMEMAAAGDDFDQDPWEGFNEKMFTFNREVLDRYLLKPAATAWDFLLPDLVQKSVQNFFDNLAVVRRVVNNALQGKATGAATELARFSINSTIGVGGLFDMAKVSFGIEQSDEDTGQTLGVWGAGPGPYLVLPFLPPLTVRDGIGYALDAAMTPYIYFAPWYATLGGSGTNIINERSLNLDRFERVAETTVDLYSAVRNAYLQRRAAAIRQ
jgi:phospholipid-binding lipoprotein MlaA